MTENEDFENKEDRLAFNPYYPCKCSYKVVFLWGKKLSEWNFAFIF